MPFYIWSMNFASFASVGVPGRGVISKPLAVWDWVATEVYNRVEFHDFNHEPHKDI